MSPRLDAELVERGLARSRARAAELIRAGMIRVDGRVATKPSAPVCEGALLESTEAADQAQWVGRAAYKLLAALEEFGPQGLLVTGRRCLDIGASTGGFTQVLLHHGAAHVTALDVGHGQLAAHLADDHRVIERSGTNIRDVTAADLGGRFDLLVADLSFISLRLVLPVMADLAVEDADLVILVKPQFEVGRERLGKGGIVRDPATRLAALRDVLTVAGQTGLTVRGVRTSPLPGTAGNVEYLGWLSPRPAADAEGPDFERLVEAMEMRS